MLPYCTATQPCHWRGGCCSEELRCVTPTSSSSNRNCLPFPPLQVSSFLLTTSFVTRRLSESEKNPHFLGSEEVITALPFPAAPKGLFLCLLVCPPQSWLQPPLSCHAPGDYFTSVPWLPASAPAVSLPYNPPFSHRDLFKAFYYRLQQLLASRPLFYK